MPRIAANLSLLFTERPFLERFDAARTAGCAAVEFQFPYEHDRAALAEVVLTSALEVVLFNLPAGDIAAGERGIACHPRRIAEFQDGVGRAIDYARLTGCGRLNCLAGIAPGEVSHDKARETLIENLRFAAVVTAREAIELVLEPLNTRDTPGFFVTNTRSALALIKAVDHGNLRLQYDIYHAQVMEGDLARTLQEHLPQIAHIQLADNPGRHEPGSGEINFPFLLSHIDRIGYAGWVGCEYIPSGRTEDSFAWLEPWRLALNGSGRCSVACSMRQSPPPMRPVACPPGCPSRRAADASWSAPAKPLPRWRARSSSIGAASWHSFPASSSRVTAMARRRAASKSSRPPTPRPMPRDNAPRRASSTR